MKLTPLDDLVALPPELEAELREMNPWWAGEPSYPVPAFRRWAFGPLLRKMETAIAPITALRGPRQVGKTTLQLQIIEHLLREKQVAPARIARIQLDEIGNLSGFNDPILALVRWYERHVLGETFNAAARADRPAYLFLDEVQNVPNWAPQLKHLVDHQKLAVLATGSSALRIETGRDSLAGRISSMEMGTLLLREIAALRFGHVVKPFLPFNGLAPLKEKSFWVELREYATGHRAAIAQAFPAFSERGGYPLAQARSDLDWPEVADQLNETIIQRAIQHDLRLGQRGKRRDAHLLEEVFRIACRYAGQAPGQAAFVPDVHHALGASIPWQRILAYLKFLDGTLLLKMIPPLEMRLKRKKGNHKLCICDHGLRASWLQEIVPIDEAGLDRTPNLAVLAGHLVESIVGYFLTGQPHLDVAHFPERGAEPEVDYILTIGEQRIPMEIKYQSRIDFGDTRGLRSFIEKSVYNAPFGILVTRNEAQKVDDPRIVCLPLTALLMLR